MIKILKFNYKQTILLLLLILSIQAAFHQHNLNNHYQQTNQQCIHPNTQKGLQSDLGLSLNIISFSEKKQIFQFNCNDNKYNLDGTQRLPDGIEQNPLYLMDYRNDIHVASNSIKYDKYTKLDTLHTNLTIDRNFPSNLKRIVGEKSDTVLKIKNKLEQQEGTTFLQASVSYKLNEYVLQDYSKIQFTPEFAQDIADLPDDYDSRQYSHFVEKWGTHFKEKITLGGRLEQTAYASPTCPLSDDSLKSNFEHYFTQELEGQEFSINEIQNNQITELTDFQLDPNFESYTDIELLNIYGGQSQNSNLKGWIDSIQDNPVIVEQTLTPILDLIYKVKDHPTLIPDTIPPAQKQKIKDKIPYFRKQYKSTQSVRKGCQIETAINFDRDAILEDNKSCYFTIFFGSYQKAEGDQCSQDDINKYTLKNPATNDLSCPSNTRAEKIAVYYYNGCTFTQFFCLKIAAKNYHPDLVQSLEICKSDIISNNFYQDNNQYYCTTNEHTLYANFKEKDKIYTCQQKFCQANQIQGKEQQGILNFYYYRTGTCTGVSAEKRHKDPKLLCGDDNCLYQYGTFHLQSDCVLHQYICLKEQYNNISCVNHQNQPPPPPPPVPKPKSVVKKKRTQTPPPAPKPKPQPQPKQQPTQQEPPKKEKSSGAGTEIFIVILISLFFIGFFIIYQFCMVQSSEAEFEQYPQQLV